MWSSGLSTISGFPSPFHRIGYGNGRARARARARVRASVLVFRRESSSISVSGFFSSEYRCSAATSDGIVKGRSPAPQKTSLVDYLVDSLGFSEEEAIAAMSNRKVKSNIVYRTNADLVVDLLRDYGLNYIEIKSLVSSNPYILKCRANRTLEPRLRVLQELGVSGSHLVEFMTLNFMRLPLYVIDYLRETLGSTEQTIKAIKGINYFLATKNVIKTMQHNVVLLQKYGVPMDRIKKFLASNPKIFLLGYFEEKLLWVVEELGTPCDSPMLFQCLMLALKSSESTLEAKMQVFRSFGWSDEEIYKLLRKRPPSFWHSAAQIRKRLEFFTTELNYTSLDLTKSPALLSYSLEKRVKPRYEIYKLLNEKKLINGKPAFPTVSYYNEQKFLDFLRCFETEVPGLVHTYTSSINDTSMKT